MIITRVGARGIESRFAAESLRPGAGGLTAARFAALSGTMWIVGLRSSGNTPSDVTEFVGQSDRKDARRYWASQGEKSPEGRFRSCAQLAFAAAVRGDADEAKR